LATLADCNEGLRQALMITPDVIVMPWSAAALKLLRALVHHARDGVFRHWLVVVDARSGYRARTPRRATA
jgi:hypothetical protein